MEATGLEESEDTARTGCWDRRLRIWNREGPAAPAAAGRSAARSGRRRTAVAIRKRQRVCFVLVPCFPCFSFAIVSDIFFGPNSLVLPVGPTLSLPFQWKPEGSSGWTNKHETKNISHIRTTDSKRRRKTHPTGHSLLAVRYFSREAKNKKKRKEKKCPKKNHFNNQLRAYSVNPLHNGIERDWIGLIPSKPKKTLNIFIALLESCQYKILH